jgi:hypothetical protein
MSDIHTNAKTLIIQAAEKSGLLREVAELLWFENKYGCPPLGCAAAELLNRLADAFDDHICMAGVVAEQLHGREGLDISPPLNQAHEVDAFLG